MTSPCDIVLAGALALMLVACKTRERSSAAPLDASRGVGVPTAAAGGGFPGGGVAQGGAGSSGGAPPFVDTSYLTAPVQLPWVPHTDDPSCQHVEVSKDCTDGWCRVPAGCFVMGSPEDEPGRAMYGEALTTVHLTRSLEMGQFEVTRAQWAETGWEMPYGAPEVEVEAGNDACDEPECPMDRVSWFAAMHYANWLSEQAEPPLEPCYVLEGCQGTVGNPELCFSEDGCADYTEYLVNCESVVANTSSASVYDCEGYRLPTEAEWEYAARAGSRTAYLTGPMSDEAAADLQLNMHEPALDDYAWYVHNSLRRAWPVGRKGANAWGLHDVLGNVDEFVSNPEWTTTEDVPAIDPWGDVDANQRIGKRGGAHTGSPQLLRVARRLAAGRMGTFSVGFRLVRTLRAE